MAKRIVILTGANRGLGRTTAEILLKKYPENFTYVFTQRSKNHDELREQFKKINPNANFDFKDLEISDKQSRTEFKNWFSQKYNKLDVLFNNVGVYDSVRDDGKQLSKEAAEYTFNVNFFSTVEFTEELYPLLTQDGKIVEISSSLGKLEGFSEKAKKLLQDETLTKEKLYEYARNYIEDVGKKELAFGNMFYHATKALLNAYVRYVASKYIKPNQSVFAVCPGWVQTDMGGPNATYTKDVACVYLANIVGEFPFARNELSGKFQFFNAEQAY